MYYLIGMSPIFESDVSSTQKKKSCDVHPSSITVPSDQEKMENRKTLP